MRDNPEATSRQGDRQSGSYGAPDDFEVDSREVVEILFSRKALIGGVAGAFGLAAGLIVFSLPNIYEIATVIEPPPANALLDSSEAVLDTAMNIKAKIESETYSSKIISDLNLDPGKKIVLLVDSKINPIDPRSVRAIKISIKEPVGEIETGKNILSKLLEELNQEYAVSLKTRMERADNQIKLVENDIVDKQQSIVRTNELLKIDAAREQEFLKEIKETQANSVKLLEKRENLLNAADKDGIASLLYTTTIHQNLVYITELENQLSSTRADEQNKLYEIEKSKSQIDQDRIQIDNLRITKNGIHGIIVVQEPHASGIPVGPHRLRYVAVALIFGAGLSALFFLATDWPRRSFR